MSNHTPVGYRDAIENVVLDLSAELGDLRCRVAAGYVLTGPDGPVYTLPADEPVLARGLETMLAATVAAPTTPEASATLGAALDRVHAGWIEHRRAVTSGHESDDRCPACRCAVLDADEAFRDLFAWASAYPYEKAAA